jgi:hypothetical protein
MLRVEFNLGDAGLVGLFVVFISEFDSVHAYISNHLIPQALDPSYIC